MSSSARSAMASLMARRSKPRRNSRVWGSRLRGASIITSTHVPTVTALVLYDVALGSSSLATVEGSLDAATWTPLAAPISSQPYQLVKLSGTARYVRLRLVERRVVQ